MTAPDQSEFEEMTAEEILARHAPLTSYSDEQLETFLKLMSPEVFRGMLRVIEQAGELAAIIDRADSRGEMVFRVLLREGNYAITKSWAEPECDTIAFLIEGPGLPRRMAGGEAVGGGMLTPLTMVEWWEEQEKERRAAQSPTGPSYAERALAEQERDAAGPPDEQLS